MIRLLLIGALLAVVLPASAFEFQQKEAFVDGRAVEHADELIVSAKKAELGGVYHEDVLVLGAERSELSGSFANDVWAAGKEVNVGGDVGDHLRVVASTIMVGGTISNRVDAMATTVEIADTATIYGGALLMGESVVVGGTVEGPVKITAQDVTLSGTIKGPIRILASDIVVLSTARLEGDIVYNADRELVLDPSIHPTGTLTRGTVADSGSTSSTQGAELAAGVIARMLWLLAALLVGLPLAALFPQFLGRSVRLLRTSALRCCFVGAAAFCLLPLVGVMLLFTFIGFPLGLILLATYGTLLYLSQFVIALAAGSALLRWRGHQSMGRVFLILLAGLLLLYILAALPIVGLACLLATALLGLGSLLLGLTGRGEATPPPLATAADTEETSS